MRKILTMTLLALGLSAGAAVADERHDRDRDRDQRVDESRRDRRDVKVVVRTDRPRVRVEHYRNFRERPVLRYERHDERRGFRFIEGNWVWNSYEWIWVPGHYERIVTVRW